MGKIMIAMDAVSVLLFFYCMARQVSFLDSKDKDYIAGAIFLICNVILAVHCCTSFVEDWLITKYNDYLVTDLVKRILTLLLALMSFTFYNGWLQKWFERKFENKKP